MIALFPANPNDPLFMVCHNHEVPVPIARKDFKDISNMLGVQSLLTFHMFQKGGTTWAFKHGVPIQHIMQHVTWASNAVWQYINSQATTTSVASPQTFSAFSTFLVWLLGGS